jgi:hypothetical protein
LIPQQLIDEKQQDEFSLTKDSLSVQRNKEYIDFFGEDKEIEKLVKEIARNKEVGYMCIVMCIYI